MGSEPTHYLSAAYLNYSSEAERDNAEIFSKVRGKVMWESYYSFNDKYLFDLMRAGNCKISSKEMGLFSIQGCRKISKKFYR